MLIPEWHTITDETIRQRIRAGQLPVIFRGLVKHWPMVAEGKKGIDSLADYLLAFDQGQPFQAMIAPASVGGRLFYNNELTGFNFDRMNGHLRDAFSILKVLLDKSPSPGFYIGSKSISEYLPGLELETPLELHSPLVSETQVDPTIWIGNATRVATHNDDSENVACVAVGRRRFTLFPPDQEANLYLGPVDITPAGRRVSLVDLINPDFDKFPLFRRAMRYVQVADLAAGDAIYIPTHWWHHVEALESVNVLINFWWKGEPPGLLTAT